MTIIIERRALVGERLTWLTADFEWSPIQVPVVAVYQWVFQKTYVQ